MEVASVLDPFLSVDLIELNHLNFATFIDEIKDNTLVFNALHGGEGEKGKYRVYYPNITSHTQGQSRWLQC